MKIISKSIEKKVVRRRLKIFARSWLCTQERWNSELVNIFFAAARYRRATVDNSHEYVRQDNSALHFRGVVLLLLRQRRGAVATTWAPRSSTCEKQRAAPRASA
jgi:hypothetical protein